MTKKSYLINNAFFLIMVLMLIILSGCVSHTVPIDKRIMLSPQEGSRGTFSRGEMTLQYNYSMAGSTMTVTGTVSHRGRVDSLDVRIVFIDGAGQVLSRTLVYSTGFRTDAARGGGDRSFQQSLTVPPEAAGFSFSYSSKERNGRE